MSQGPLAFYCKNFTAEGNLPLRGNPVRGGIVELRVRLRVLLRLCGEKIFFEGEVVMPKLNQDQVRECLYQACVTPEQLKIWVEGYLGMKVPRESVCPGHDAPFEYLRRAYFEPGEDLIVWAPARRREDAAGGGGDVDGAAA